jgi:gluconokinase
MAKAVILMGVSGSGKSSIGLALSARLGWSFYDGDDFHTPQSVEKMSNGIPLSDEDRFPWLDTLNRLIVEKTKARENLILACSALKRSYRQRLRRGITHLNFIYLDGEYDLIWSRMQARGDHYMKPAMLQSQFKALEMPRYAVRINIDQPVEAIIESIITALETTGKRSQE